MCNFCLLNIPNPRFVDSTDVEPKDMGHYSGGRGSQISVSLRLAWSTEGVPGKSEQHRESVSTNKIQTKQKVCKIGYFPSFLSFTNAIPGAGRENSVVKRAG